MKNVQKLRTDIPYGKLRKPQTDIPNLLKEDKAIQKKFSCGRCFNKKTDLTNSLSHCLFEGKVKAALCILNESGTKADQFLSISSPMSEFDPSFGTVYDGLIKKHTDSYPVPSSYSLLHETLPQIMIHTTSPLIRLMVSSSVKQYSE